MSTDLLTRLNAAGLHARVASRVPEPPSTQAGEFARALANEGAIPVRIAPGVDVALSEDQLARLAPEADKAEANGAGRALVLMDGKVYKLDVAARTITGMVGADSGSVEAGYDAVISVPSKTDSTIATSNGAALLRRLAGVAGLFARL